MFSLSKKGDYGLELLAALVNYGTNSVVPLARLTKGSHLPYRFASQLAVGLKAAGILGSKEGVGGGYFLARDPRNITVAQVVRALEGDEGLVECVRQGFCRREKECQARSVWNQIQSDIAGVLGKYTIADLVEKADA